MALAHYDLFIDESCHLEHDHKPVMCIGYVKVPKEAYTETMERIGHLKAKHRTFVELKWNKFSNSRLPLYKDLVDLFFDSQLEFRCIIVKHKERLRHDDFNQGSHDNYYYKLVYYLLHPNAPGISDYRVFLDKKDTRGREKLRKIREVLDIEHLQINPFSHFQHLQSDDNLYFQITDLLIGAVTYKARKELGESLNHAGKLELIRYLEAKSGYSIDEGTAPWEPKFNIFDHQPRVN